MNINNKSSIIKGEIFIIKDDINKDIRIINSFKNAKREVKWKIMIGKLSMKMK